VIPAALAPLVRVGFIALVVLLAALVELVIYLWRTRPRRGPQPRRRRYPVARPFAPPPDRRG
jgi:hypothetical protein